MLLTFILGTFGLMPKGVYQRKSRERRAYPPATVERVRERYAAGMTQAEIAAEIGLSQKVIFNLMHRHGIEAGPAVPRDQRGHKNGNWSGDTATYQAFHKRLYALHGKPERCSVCGTTKAKAFDYANLSGNYANPADYAPMCRSCHWKNDQKVLNISHMRERLSV